MDISQALALWVKFTGVNPNPKGAQTTTLGDLQDVSGPNDTLREALALDPSGLTPALLLNAFLNDYLAAPDRAVSLAALLEPDEALKTRLAEARKLKSILASPEIVGMKTLFVRRTLEALTHYGIDRDDVRAVVQDTEQMVWLRFSALKSLSALQFLPFGRGARDDRPPTLFRDVYGFWDINTLIGALRAAPQSGVFLALVREPTALTSYFAFAVRNGDNIGILTDKPNWAHPLQKDMTRRPGKRFNERVDKNYFPYQLLDLEYDYRGDARAKPGSAVVPYEATGTKVMQIADMAPEEVIWYIMMCSLIQEKYFHNDWGAAELCYTGKMVKVEELPPGESRALILADQSITVPPLTPADISGDALQAQWDRPSAGVNRWAEERYAEAIKTEHLNRMEGRDEPLLLPAPERALFPAVVPGETALPMFSPTTVGTAKELLEERQWFARHTQAKLVDKAMAEEFARRKLEVYETYRDMVGKNLPALLKAIARGEFIAPHMCSVPGNAFEYAVKDDNILVLHVKKKERDSLPSVSDNINLYGERTPKLAYPCVITGAPTPVIAVFRPTTAEALALLAGVAKEDLPDVLQHWMGQEPYHGNSILDRLDPMDWAAKNPWNKMRFQVGVHLSKSGYNQLRREQGLPPNPIWKNKEARDLHYL